MKVQIWSKQVQRRVPRATSPPGSCSPSGHTFLSSKVEAAPYLRRQRLTVIAELYIMTESLWD